MRAAGFRWIEWNLEHATKHGCSIEEIESVVLRPPRGFPRNHGHGKILVQGRGIGGRVIEVIYVLDDDGKTAFVIHAMPLTTRRRRSR